jgi:hypothetical protein
MRARILQSIAVCGLLAVAVLTARAFVPEKPPEPPTPSQERAIELGNWRHQKVCPAGHETEIVMGQMHLHVEMRLIARLEIEDFQDVPDGCPAGAIFVRSMSFGGILGTKEYDDLIQSRGLPLNYMELDRIVPERYREPAEIPEDRDRRIVVEGIGYIDDISHWPPLSSPASRKYRLHYLSLPGVAPSTIEMICHGDVQTRRWRYCSTYYRYGDLRVEYEFQQETKFPHDQYRPAPVKEPDEFLAMDTGIRAWIESMLLPGSGVQ